MGIVLACIDGSAYGASVCDHAAWLAGSTDADILVLHVDEETSGRKAVSPGGKAAKALVATAVERLRDHGASRVDGHVVSGPFVEAASALGAEIIVMGKRGSGGEGDPGGLGRQVEGMIRATETTLCFTSKVHLPVHRALALLDADMSHRRSVEVMQAHPGLRELEADLVVVADPETAAPKLAWARLGARQPAFAQR